MQHFSNRLWIVLYLLLICAPWGLAIDIQNAAPQDVGLSAERLQRIHNTVQDYINKNQIAGVVTLVARHGKVALLEAQGKMDIEKNQPMQTDTIFRIASMTKPITSVAVMMLYEDGKFLLNDPVSKYIPEFKEPKVCVPNPEGASEPYKLVPANQEITIRQLLTHTSGISYPFQGRKYITDFYKEAGITNGISETPFTTGEMIKKLARLPLYHQPGEAFEYGLNTDVLGYLVEVISGKTLDQFLLERLFKPLGMTDSYFFLPKEKLSRFSSVYTPDEKGGLKKLMDGPITMGNVLFSVSFHYKEPQTYFSGGGGLAATIGDYYRFLQMLLNQGKIPGSRLLSRKSVELITSNHIGDMSISFRNRGYAFGLGFAVNMDLGAVGELGSKGEYNWGGFYYTYFWVDPKEDLIGIFMSQLYPSPIDLSNKFKVLAYQAIDD